MHGDICFYKFKMHSHSKSKKTKKETEISGFCFNQDQGLKASSTHPEPNFFF